MVQTLSQQTGQRIFDKKNVILTHISESDLQSFLIDSDVDDNGDTIFRFSEFAESILETVPEYVFAQYTSSNIQSTNIITCVREAAKSIYKIKEYDLMRRACLENDISAQNELKKLPFNKRGEFGELILHLILRDFKRTIPLISKVYFKDSANVPAHGFDSVHISPSEKILWLGESKFYCDSKNGIKALLDDINNHFKKDYLNEQIVIIKKNLECNDIPQRNEWISALNNTPKLSDQLKMINIPLLCTYEHNIYNLFTDIQSNDALEYHEADVRELKRYFDDNNNHPNKSRLNIILMLLPIKSKAELVRILHEKLWHMQNI